MKKLLIFSIFLLALSYHLVIYTIVCLWQFKFVKWSNYITGHYKVSSDDSHIVEILLTETFWKSVKRWFNGNYYFE